MSYNLLDKLSDVEKHHWERYQRASHAMQSGVKAVMEFSPGGMSVDSMPKHLRTGVNSAMVETSALSRILIAKGIFNREEYFRSIADVMEEEAHRYEEMLQAITGVKIKLDWRLNGEIPPL